MLCRICKEDKLSKEFIPYPITSECKHPRLICLRCATKAGDIGKCPYNGCGQLIVHGSCQIKQFRLMLNYLFAEVEEDENIRSSRSSDSVCVIRITGESNFYKLHESTTVSHLKVEIKKDLDIEKTKQVLLYRGKEIKECIDNEPQVLSKYIKPGSTIVLMVLLYAIPEHFNHVTFDLTWNYPEAKKDYLDATCLVFSHDEFIQHVDFGQTYMAPASAETQTGRCEVRGIQLRSFEVDIDKMSINHTSDDLMDDVARKGKHTIDVYIKRLPSHITHLFFALSAWEHPTISHFPNPSLRFYEASNRNENLCETTFIHALDSSAVIMCSMSRADGEWRVVRSGALSAGNAKNYRPMIAKVQKLIREGQC